MNALRHCLQHTAAFLMFLPSSGQFEPIYPDYCRQNELGTLNPLGDGSVFSYASAVHFSAICCSSCFCLVPHTMNPHRKYYPQQVGLHNTSVVNSGLTAGNGICLVEISQTP
ncbi:hypothetical protein CSKR_202230 [Clonorchis sinensis]|uniref:Secreted protein n=1 Tax=Clonorchis sinensis TaxID=79923 RepID=A0A8T1LXQ6_CLOSI|nr:hypothetical protein CSKR_202230 [Clonorchis sinensis]